ncbi:F-box/kelch-repeat protein At3g06240, partial [Linum perenne]
RHEKSQNYCLFEELNGDFPPIHLQDLDPPFQAANNRNSAALRIAGCCNGVICFTDYLSNNLNAGAALWNPCIRKLVVIPPPIKSDPSCTRTVGFGFDALNDDYKLVRVSSTAPKDYQSIRVYDTGVHIDGICYWLATRSNPGHNVNVIVSFSLRTEALEEMPIPEDNDSVPESHVALASCKGLLSLVFHEYQHESNKDRATIWVMKQGSWMNLAIVESSHIKQKILAFQDNGLLLFTALTGFFGEKECLVQYDLKTREEVELIVVEDLGLLQLDANYVESLALL